MNDLIVVEAPASEADFQKLLKLCKPTYVKVPRSLYNDVLEQYAGTIIRTNGTRYEHMYISPGGLKTIFLILPDD